MMHRLVPLLLVLALARSAFACSLSLESAGGQQWIGGNGRGYDVFDSTALYQTLTINVHALDSACPFYVTVTPLAVSGNEGTLSGGGGSLRYTIYRDPGGKQILQMLQPQLAQLDAELAVSKSQTATARKAADELLASIKQLRQEAERSSTAPADRDRTTDDQ